MKKIVLAILFIIFSLQLYCQTDSYYLKKAGAQRRTGWILIGAGSALAVVGFFVSTTHENENNFGYAPDFDTGAWMFLAGSCIDVASVPFFISSSVNERRTTTAAISFERLKLKLMNTNGETYPAISLSFKINYKRAALHLPTKN